MKGGADMKPKQQSLDDLTLKDTRLFLRINRTDLKLIQIYADLHDTTVSQLVRSYLEELIQDNYDILIENFYTTEK